MALTIEGLEGGELSKGDYLRTSVPEESRWADAWSVFKSNFGGLVLLNLLICLTLAPAGVLLYFCSANISILGLAYPHNPGLGYPFYPDLSGLNEQVTLSTDLMYYALLIAAGAIASLGISGGAYCIRKMLNTHGEFKFKSFFRGIKVGYLKTLLPVTLFLVLLFACVTVGDWMRLVSATGGNRAGAITAFVFIIIFAVLVGLYCLWLFAVGTTYKLKFGTLLKNSLAFTFKTPLQTVLMAGFTCIPVWLFLIGGFFRTIALIVLVVIGAVFMLLSWTAYTQWVFDAVVQPVVQTGDKSKLPKTKKQLEAERAEQEARTTMELLAAGRSELIARPVLPLPAEISFTAPAANFTRADVAAAATGREKLNAEVTAYEEAHKNDPTYAEYNKLFAERDKALKSDDKKGKGKKISAANLLK